VRPGRRRLDLRRRRGREVGEEVSRLGGSGGRGRGTRVTGTEGDPETDEAGSAQGVDHPPGPVGRRPSGSTGHDASLDHSAVEALSGGLEAGYHVRAAENGFRTWKGPPVRSPAMPELTVR